MYDIHSHIIYGIDDGAPDKETAESLLVMAANTGTSDIIATPHVIEAYKHPSWETILEGVAELKALSTQKGIQLQIYPGAEIMLSLDILSIYDEAPHAFCLNNTHYTLVELPMLEVPHYTEDLFYQLQLKGLTPILAHPERYGDLFARSNGLERLLDWCNKGILLQINAGSILGKFGTGAQENAELLLKNKLVSFIGSDAHRVKYRNTDLSKEKERLEALCDKDYVEKICIQNPRAMLAGEIINIDIPSKIQTNKKKASFWTRIFG